jgi:hypothetical protein
METYKSILNKTPEQIFNELTANMDTRSRYEYIKYMHDNIFAGNNSLWKIIRFAYAVFGMYSTDRPHTIYAKQIHDVCNDLYLPGAVIPKYLHGVIDKQTKKYKHPYDRLFIVKPMRGMSQQYMAQYRKVAAIFRYFERIASIPSENTLLPVVSELYKELQQLVSMTRVCMVPKVARDVMKTGSVQMLQEYNLYASAGTVSNAVTARRDITARAKSNHKKTRDLLRQLHDNEMARMRKRHEEEQISVTNFAEFQNLLRRQEQERSELLRTQRDKINAFCQSHAQRQKKIEEERRLEKAKAQMKMARISRMR